MTTRPKSGAATRVASEDLGDPILLDFIEQVIVPLLLHVMETEGHLYSAKTSYYDDRDNDLAQAA